MAGLTPKPLEGMLEELGGDKERTLQARMPGFVRVDHYRVREERVTCFKRDKPSGIRRARGAWRRTRALREPLLCR